MESNKKEKITVEISKTVEQIVFDVVKFKCPTHGVVDNSSINVDIPKFGFYNVDYCLICFAEQLDKTIPRLKKLPTEEKSSNDESNNSI